MYVDTLLKSDMIFFVEDEEKIIEKKSNDQNKE
jgi:hypothetical protein